MYKGHCYLINSYVYNIWLLNVSYGYRYCYGLMCYKKDYEEYDSEKEAKSDNCHSPWKFIITYCIHRYYLVRKMKYVHSVDAQWIWEVRIEQTASTQTLKQQLWEFLMQQCYQTRAKLRDHADWVHIYIWIMCIA